MNKHTTTILITTLLLGLILTACNQTSALSMPSNMQDNELTRTSLNNTGLIEIGDISITELIVFPSNQVQAGQNIFIRVDGTGNLPEIDWQFDETIITESDETEMVGFHYTAPEIAGDHTINLTATYLEQTEKIPISITVEDPTATFTPTSTNAPIPTFTPIPTDTPTATNTPTPSPTVPTATSTPNATETAIAQAATQQAIQTQTAEVKPPTPTATVPTPIPLYSALHIEDCGPGITHETCNSAFLLNGSNVPIRWKPWNAPDNVPNGWYYLLSFSKKGNSSDVFLSIPVSNPETMENGWIGRTIDIYEDFDGKGENGCYPYWDVIVVIDVNQVNCSEEQLINKTMCQLTGFPRQSDETTATFQRGLGTAAPGACPGGGGGSGSQGGRGPIPLPS
ncbi:hypothetical protein QUF64_08920 [Anaerolineales bacterium HSG6]|nr:hypothetical protein [Anaerolineales bacterium HSG6]